MKRFIFLFMVLFLQGCTHSGDSQFEQNLTGLKCEQAAANLPGSDPLAKTAQNINFLSRQIVAYSYITAGYATEVLWDGTTGTILTVVLCSPTIAAVVLASRQGNLHSGNYPFVCLPVGESKGNPLASPPLGRMAKVQTRKLRCPDLTSVSHSVRKVASCYEARGGADNLNKAVTSLKNIEASEDFFKCLSAEDQAAVVTQKQRLEENLKAIKPGV